jgi:hypothetical protein
MIFSMSLLFENRVEQFVYMKNMSRKREIQKVKTRWLVFGDVSMMNVYMYVLILHTVKIITLYIVASIHYPSIHFYLLPL